MRSSGREKPTENFLVRAHFERQSPSVRKPSVRRGCEKYHRNSILPNQNKIRGSAIPAISCVYATRLAVAGVSDTIIDQLLGHSRRDILRFYTGRVPEYLRDAINRLEQFRAIKAGIACKSAIANGERLGKVSTSVQ